jgi:PAS domain S-box-containing protein
MAMDMSTSFSPTYHLDLKTVENAERFALFVEAVAAGIWDWDIETDEEWWSDRFYQTLGYAPGELKANYRNWLSNILHPEDRPLVEDAVRQHLQNRVPYRVEVRQKHKTLGYRWFETQGQAKFDSDGKPTRMVGSIIDVHSRKTGQMLQEKYEFLLEEMSAMGNIGAWEYHAGDLSPRWSPQIYTIHGLVEAEQPDLTTAVNYYIPEHRPIIQEAVERGLSEGTDYDVDLQLLMPDGKTKWVRIIGKPFYHTTGAIAGIRGVIMDVNTHKTMELERLRTINLLSSQNNRLQNFAHIVSHNLRSHASNLQMLISFIDQEKDPGQVQLLTNMLRTTSSALTETLDNLGEVIKMQNLTNVKKTQVNLKDIFDKTLIILQGSIETTGIKIASDFAAFSTIEFDQVYAESVVLNLVSNAVKYHDPCKTSWVNLFTHISDEGRLGLSVQDNGLGMDLDNIGDRLFGMYKTFHNNADARGLGLFLTKNQVESMGGIIEVQSRPSYGTTFTVWF